METIMLLFGLSIAGLAIGLVCYSEITSNIIKSQEREIRKLRYDNRRLKSALMKKKGGNRKSQEDSLFSSIKVVNNDDDIMFGD